MRCKFHSLEVTDLLKTRGCCSGSTRFDVCTRAVLGMTVRPDQGAASQTACDKGPSFAADLWQRLIILHAYKMVWSFCLAFSSFPDWWLILSLLLAIHTQKGLTKAKHTSPHKQRCSSSLVLWNIDVIPRMIVTNWWYCHHGCLILPWLLGVAAVGNDSSTCGSPIRMQCSSMARLVRVQVAVVSAREPREQVGQDTDQTVPNDFKSGGSRG